MYDGDQFTKFLKALAIGLLFVGFFIGFVLAVIVWLGVQIF